MSSQYPQGWGPHGESPFRSDEPSAATAALWPQSQPPVEPQMAPPPPPPPPRSTLPLIALSVAVGGLLVVGAALGATLYGKSKASNKATPTATVTAPPNDGGGSISTTTTTETTTLTPTLPTIAPPAAGDDARIPGTDAQGFTNGTARCNVDDPAVFIGRTQRSSVVICQSEASGGLYYIGYAGGMRSKDVSWPQMHGSTYVFRAGSTVYEVGPSELTIVTPSQTVVEPWLQQWHD